VCDFSSYTRGDLEKHSNIVHLGKKPFKCDHCDKAFGQKGHLNDHINSTHLEKKDFKCDICDKAFALKHHLVRNVNRLHKNIKSYSCELCSYTSCTKGDLKNHSIWRHSPKKAHRHDLDDLMKEAQKDEMMVSIENIIVCE
jgi:uncharacterized Zn-finger protein